MQDTPKGLRMHIGLFGRRNVGKSSLLNALVRQPVSIVSDTPGTTTDPVEKTLEMLPVGPVVFLDTAGLDDEGALGRQRAERSLRALHRVDVALIILGEQGWGDVEEGLAAQLKARGIAFFVVQNKADRIPSDAALVARLGERSISLLRASANNGMGLDDVRAAIARLAPDQALHEPPLVSDLLPERGVLLLVVPIDSGAPKGRLILPQVQTIRNALDGRKMCLVVTEEEVLPALDCLKEPPALVVCDSQVVKRVAADTPASIPLTTFSVLMARIKGDLVALARGAGALRTLKAGDAVLVMEACSHHAQKDDIGRVKIPRLLKACVGGDLIVDIAAGKEFTELERPYHVITHCGGCTITRGQMLGRLHAAQAAGIPMTNYGLTISFAQGVMERVLQPFPEALAAYLQEVLEGYPL